MGKSRYSISTILILHPMKLINLKSAKAIPELPRYYLVPDTDINVYNPMFDIAIGIIHTSDETN